MANTVISDKCMEFSILGVKTAKRLKALHEFEFASQLLRSSTSVGANVSEANYAQSRADFISKMQIALKECNETLYWLSVLKATEIIEAPDMVEVGENIMRLLTSSIKTARHNAGK